MTGNITDKNENDQSKIYFESIIMTSPLCDYLDNLQSVFPFANDPSLSIFNDEGQRVYARDKLLGEGTYGKVYKAKNTQTNETVVIKQMKRFPDEEEGLQSTTLREVSILKHFECRHIVKLLDVFWTDTMDFCLVFEFCQMDLFKYIEQQRKKNKNVSLKLIKKWSFQMLAGLNHMHSHRILHRDLKPQNILISKDMNAKIGDLGLSREHSLPIPKLTKTVVTLWYRAPEILLGTELYSTKIDIWSLGLIIAEIGRCVPLFDGQSELEMILDIFQFFGTPQNDENSLETLPYFNKKFPKFKGCNFDKQMGCLQHEPLACELLKQMLVLDPNKRMNAKRLLDHSWFDKLESIKDENAQKDDDVKWDKFFDEMSSTTTEKIGKHENGNQSEDERANLMQSVFNVPRTPKKSDMDKLVIEYENKYGFLPIDVSDFIQFGKEHKFKIGIIEAEKKIRFAMKKKEKFMESEQGFGSRRIRSGSDIESKEFSEDDQNEDMDLEYHRMKQQNNNKSMYQAVGVKNIGSMIKIESEKMPFQDVTKSVLNENQIQKHGVKQKEDGSKKRSRFSYEGVPDLENVPPAKKCRI